MLLSQPAHNIRGTSFIPDRQRQTGAMHETARPTWILNFRGFDTPFLPEFPCNHHVDPARRLGPAIRC
jgi:hypothetical protein